MYGQELIEAIRIAIVTHRLDAIKESREPNVVAIALTPQSYQEVLMATQDSPVWWQETYRDNGSLQQRMYGCDIRVDYMDEHKMIVDGLFFKLLQSS